ncbi:MAG: DUF389 domain-containing protein [Bacteroidales bacterium]|nr:DUF389 domain-containing protein [Bacteroidales bacterium]
MTLKEILQHLKQYFNLRPHKEDESEIIDQINSGITFRGGNLWVLIFAILIASLGLNVNSTAVIIGAMLISPLMGPIIGMGFALGTNDLDMLKRAAKNYAISTLISILTATLYWFLTPLSDAQSELLARTSPTLYDVLIAFCGGAAGIIALCTKGKSNVIPGVAIATALMPPLCTAGFGLGTGHIMYFLGAFYLFFINTVFICLATLGGVKLMHFKKKVFLTPERERRVRQIVTTVVVVTMIPAAIVTANIVKKSIFDSNVSRFVKNELSQTGTQVISTDVDKENLTLRVVAVGREFGDAAIRQAESQMGNYSLDKYRLTIIQGAQSDSILLLNNKLSQISASREEEHRRMQELSQQVGQYESRLAEYARLETINSEIASELPILFPAIESISLSRQSGETDGKQPDIVSAYVEPKKGKFVHPDDARRLRQWLKARTEADSIALFVARRK